MKIRTLFFAAALLLSGAGFAGCSDSDEQPTAAGTPPVTPSREVTDFFDAHLDEYSIGINFDDMSFNFNYISDVDGESECFVVNSEEEFRAIVKETVELPDIDFAKYSLIVGQHVFEEPRYSLESQAVETGTDALTLNLVYREMRDGVFPAAVATYYFWGLYDKLPEYEVNVNITTF